MLHSLATSKWCAHTPAMWLYILTISAYVLQIAGAILVVLEVLKSHRMARQLDTAFTNIDKGYELAVADAAKQIEEAGIMGPIIKPLAETDMQARYIHIVTVLLRTYIGESWPKHRWTWFVGPVALVLGLALGLWSSLAALGPGLTP